MTNGTTQSETVEDALIQALVAFGSGTGQIHVQSLAIKTVLTDAFRQDFTDTFSDDPKRWKAQKLFVLACARAIGRLAAQNAIARGSIVIEEKDLFDARDKVVMLNQGPAPGPWCRSL